MPGTSAFPVALDAYTDIAPNTSESVRSHSGEHNNLLEAMLQVQTKIGIDDSADVDSFDFRIDAIEDFLNALAIADVAGLQDALDAKADASHGHAIADVSGLQTALDGKADTSHTHSAGDITSGAFDAARIAGGTPSAGHVPTYQGDGSVDWVAPSGGSGDVATDAIWDAAGDLAVGTGANAAARLAKGADGQVLTVVSGDVAWADPSAGGSSSGAIGATFDGGGEIVAAGAQCDVLVPFDCAITKVTILADISTNAVVDVWRDTYANFPPVDGDSITASAPPTLSGALKNEDATLTGWSTSITAGQTLRFNVDSCSAATRLTVILHVTKS